MTAVGDKVRLAIPRIFTRVGISATLERPVGVYDAVLGGVPNASIQTTDIKITPPMVSEKDGVSSMESLIQASSSNFEPSIGDIIRFNDEAWNIIGIGRIMPDEKVAVYSITIKRHL